MTTLDLSAIKPIPGFDCVKMKREIQAKIYEETKGMTRGEVREYIRKGAERLDEERQLRRSAENQT
jgi:hypothetical protein